MSEPEVWLRGPIADVAPLLQPVAHSLLQCRNEVRATLAPLSHDALWARPVDAATAAYHVRHAMGSLDRLLTYARGEQLTPAQLATLRSEDDPNAGPADAPALIAAFDDAIARALEQVSNTPTSILLETRLVGRGQLPSTVIGLLFHAAEHTQRHVGQLATTVRFTHAASGASPER